MGGSSPTRLKAGLGNLEGIAIDSKSLRLYWTAGWVNGEDNNRVESIDPNGSDVKLVRRVPIMAEESAPWPWGITLFGDQVFWTNSETKNLNRVSMTGEKTSLLLHTANQTLHHFWQLLHIQILPQIGQMTARATITQHHRSACFCRQRHLYMCTFLKSESVLWCLNLRVTCTVVHFCLFHSFFRFIN